MTVEYAARIEEELDGFGEGREAWFRRFCAVREDTDLLGAYAAHMTEVERSLVRAHWQNASGTIPLTTPILPS